MPRAQIKDERVYESLRRQGAGKEKAARVANASANRGRASTGRQGGRSPRYEEWNRRHLYEKAKEVGIEGRSKMDKRELVDALRNH